VTGFVGSGSKPTPLSRREVERILGVKKEAEEGVKAAPRFKPEWDVGETVRVVDGPFADFNGLIEDMNIDQSKVRVLVNIFGRETPVELNFEQIQKL
jgi:transcriptional antiterminator NusG